MKFSGLTIVAPRSPEQPRDVAAGEAAARDEHSASRLPRAPSGILSTRFAN